MANPLHGTTAPGVVLPITLDKKYRRGAVMNRDGADEVWFTTDGTDPVIGADGCGVLPAAIGEIPVDFTYGAGTPVVKMISASVVDVSVRGLGR